MFTESELSYGTVKKVIFHKEAKYIVAAEVTNNDGTIDAIKLIFTSSDIYQEGDSISFSGNETNSEKYGKQIDCTYIRKAIEKDIDKLSQFLLNEIDGVGSVTVAKLVETFGQNLGEVISHNPMLITDFGVSENKVRLIADKWNAYISNSNSLNKLISMKFTPEVANSLLNKYGSRAVEILRENPYKAFEDIGYEYNDIDNIILAAGTNAEMDQRVQATIVHLLAESEKYGNNAINYNGLISRLKIKNITNLPTILLNLENLENSSKIKIREFKQNKYYYLYETYYEELSLASELAKIKNIDNEPHDGFIERINNNSFLTENQKEIIINAATSRISIIYGPKFSGKTTLIRNIMYAANNKEVILELDLSDSPLDINCLLKNISAATLIIIKNGEFLSQKVLLNLLRQCKNQAILIFGDNNMPSSGFLNMLIDSIYSQELQIECYRKGYKEKINFITSLISGKRELSLFLSSDFIQVVNYQDNLDPVHLQNFIHLGGAHDIVNRINIQIMERATLEINDIVYYNGSKCTVLGKDEQKALIKCSENILSVDVKILKKEQAIVSYKNVEDCTKLEGKYNGIIIIKSNYVSWRHLYRVICSLISNDSIKFIISINVLEDILYKDDLCAIVNFVPLELKSIL